MLIHCRARFKGEVRFVTNTSVTCQLLQAW